MFSSLHHLPPLVINHPNTPISYPSAASLALSYSTSPVINTSKYDPPFTSPFTTFRQLPRRLCHSDFQLKIRQQPRQARMCGVGDKGERLIFF